MWKVLGGVVAGAVLAQWVVPAILKRPTPTSTQRGGADDGLPEIHRITGDALNTFEKLRPFLWQLHVDSADGSLTVADYLRAGRQLQQSNII